MELSDEKESQKQSDIQEAIEREWDIPNFTMKEIREAIPAHCFHRDTFRSFTYLFNDLFIMSTLIYGASYIHTIPTAAIHIALWPLYWFAQGTIAVGLWFIAHECNHLAFSSSKIISHSIGLMVHSALLVPYYSFGITHSKHHKGNGHMTKDTNHVPLTRSQGGFPKRELDPAGKDGHNNMFDETPVVMFLHMALVLTFGMPSYILFNMSGQDYSTDKNNKSTWISHFNPYCPLFKEKDFWQVAHSVMGVSMMVGILIWIGQQWGLLAVIKFYMVPYMVMNIWIILITYLQHVHPDMPHYRGNVWNFQRGAALTVDRSYGPIVNYIQHHSGDTHVVHHFFSTIPHYHAVEATKHIKKVLGKYYFFDDTPILTAFHKSWKQCRFVEDEGDVVFYKN
ncbi:delta-12-fatty acid desaturase [Phascolomyces articulosus]|uniref:Delta-12-fatty acid desaturase n=1 Tax=Phascolomyces articulosus TaxID=60185 RepID=A0AAD5JS19_9FUNG|nr:delta-12-fatty acid desaturase [Phascolomyces articulosus]